MSFDNRESSRTLGAPISLYLIRYGDTAESYFAYTNAEQPVAYAIETDDGPQDIVFEPIAIRRSAVSVSGSLDKSSLTLRTPEDIGLTELFMGPTPSQEISLVIWDGHVGEETYILAWAGRILTHAGEGSESTFTCEPISTAQKRTGLTRNYQIHCPLVLYGPDCRASQAAATISRNPLAVNGPLVTLAPDWETTSTRKRKYAGGMVTWVRDDGRTERRSIIRLQSDDVLILSSAAAGLTSAHALQISLGCNHDMADCQELHGNIQNYGGQPFIPSDNPFGIKNNFY